MSLGTVVSAWTVGTLTFYDTRCRSRRETNLQERQRTMRLCTRIQVA